MSRSKPGLEKRFASSKNYSMKRFRGLATLVILYPGSVPDQALIRGKKSLMVMQQKCH